MRSPLFHSCDWHGTSPRDPVRPVECPWHIHPAARWKMDLPIESKVVECQIKSAIYGAWQVSWPHDSKRRRGIRDANRGAKTPCKRHSRDRAKAQTALATRSTLAEDSLSLSL